MSVLIVPDLDEEPWPTLGPQICDLMEERGIYGPGSLKKQPYKLTPEKRAAVYRAYEVYPQGHPFAGRRRFKRVGLSWRKGTAKCLDGGVLVTMADGSRKRADQVRGGDRLVSWDGERLVVATVVGCQEQPPAPRYRVTTEKGRSLVVTGEHPFAVQGTRWTPGMPKRRRYPSCDPDAATMQWVKASELRPKDRLVVALGWTGDSSGLDEYDAWTLGAMTGDGGGDGRFTNVDAEILDRLRERYTLTPLAGDHRSYYVRGIKPLLHRHGLAGCNAHTKRVPAAVFTGSRAVIAAFLAGYLDTDGHVALRPRAGGKAPITVEWASVNRELLADCQHLLAALGVNASLRASRSRVNGQPYVAWKLGVHDHAQASLLAELLPLVHGGKRAMLRTIADRVGRCTFAGRNHDRVATVERLADGPSVAIEVAGTHTHVTAGVITHNTEFAAMVAFCELHPEGPVRCDGFDASGNPVGRPVTDPYIPMLAYTEEQVEKLAFGALYFIISEGPDADLFDVGLDRIIRLDERGRHDGEAVPLAGSPNANDGARTTFQHFDETHRLYLPRLVEAHETMLGNIPKRPLDDPWSFETTTAGEPGAGSVAEKTHKEAEKISRGLIEDPDLFYFHRQASDDHDLETLDGRIDAAAEATGPDGEYGPGQFREIARQWDRDGADKAYLERVWLNRWTKSGAQAFDVKKFDLLGPKKGEHGEPLEERTLAHGSFITLGFDGARFKDATALVATDIPTGLQMPIGLWERPEDADEWEVPEDEVDDVLEDTMRRFKVWKLYADPPHWVETVGKWAGKYPDQVVEWWTFHRRPMGMAIRAYQEAIDSGALSHTGDADLLRHVGNAGKVKTNLVDDEGKTIFILGKIAEERKFDECMAAVLSWRARLDAVASGAKPPRSSTGFYVPFRAR